jgi:hypothetical protein
MLPKLKKITAVTDLISTDKGKAILSVWKYKDRVFVKELKPFTNFKRHYLYEISKDNLSQFKENRENTLFKPISSIYEINEKLEILDISNDVDTLFWQDDNTKIRKNSAQLKYLIF